MPDPISPPPITVTLFIAVAKEVELENLLTNFNDIIDVL